METSFSPRRRRLVRAGAAVALLPLAGLPRAQTAAPLKLIVPFTPGTTPDVVARLLQPKLEASLTRPVVVDNRPGASGMLGMDVVAKAPPDGATLLFGTSTGLTLPFVYAKVPFDVLGGFTPLTLIGTTNFALVAHPSVPAKTATELVAWLKAQKQAVDYASPGKGTFQHLAMEWLAHLTGAPLNHVPYRGSGPAQADLLGGHVKLMIVPLHVAAPLAADGRLTLIGATRRERDPAFPAAIPLHEQGIAGFDADAWYAVWGPRGLPSETTRRLGEALRAALGEADVKAALTRQGIAVQPSSGEALQQLAQAESAKWDRLIQAIKLPKE